MSTSDKTVSVYGELYRLMALLKTESSEAKSMRAQFRHASSISPGEDPILWGWLVSNLNPELQGSGENVSYAEYAIYITLSMLTIGPENDGQNTLAEAAALSEIKRHKLSTVETAADIKEMQIELRGLIRLIASKGYAFNYGKLAEDIYSWQFNKTKIARKWEREYARKEKK